MVAKAGTEPAAPVTMSRMSASGISVLVSRPPRAVQPTEQGELPDAGYFGPSEGRKLSRVLPADWDFALNARTPAALSFRATPRLRAMPPRAASLS
jgi:hypothetical protein